MEKNSIVNALFSRIYFIVHALFFFQLACFATTQHIEVQARNQPPPPSPVSVVPANLAPQVQPPAPPNRVQRCTEWLKLNWKPAALITSVLTVGAVCGYLSWTPDSAPLFPGNNCVPFPRNGTQPGCYAITMHNCGSCNGNLPAQVRCAPTSSTLFPAIEETIKSICENDTFELCFEEKECSTAAQPTCIDDNFGQQITYLNQTCGQKTKKINLHRFKKAKKSKYKNK